VLPRCGIVFENKAQSGTLRDVLKPERSWLLCGGLRKEKDAGACREKSDAE